MNGASHHAVRRCHKPQNNAARERSRVKTLRSAFLDLQRSLPAVPPNTKLSKLDVLVLATTYIYHLTKTLERQNHQSLTSPGVSGSNLTWKLDHGLKSHVRQHSAPLVYRPQSQNASRHCRHHARGFHVHVTGRVLERDATEDHVILSRPVGVSCGSQTAGQNMSGQQLSGHIVDAQKDARETSVTGDSVGHLSASTTHRTLGVLRPVKKWPMRSRLYDSILGCTTKGTLLSHYK
uniref:BHLH domain-containing protein n=1 Tax=Biomphalaria glabrata TaxID=6526 RepID=A0A2C9JKC6_BIOGL